MGHGDRDKRKQHSKPKKGEKESVSTVKKPQDTDKQTEEEDVDVSKKESDKVGEKDDKIVKAGEEECNKPKVKFVPSLKEPEKEDKKYARREIVSNWKKYEEELLHTPEEEDEALRGADFGDVLSMSSIGGSHFRLKSEREWDEAESAFTNEFFSLDLKNLARALTCVPFHKRLRIPESCFTQQMLMTMEKDAAQLAAKYVPPERTFMKRDVKPVNQAEEFTKRFLNKLKDDVPKDKTPQVLVQELNKEAEVTDVLVIEKTTGVSECNGPQDGDVGYHSDSECKPVDNVSVKQVFPDAICKSELKATEGTSEVENQDGDGAMVEAEDTVVPETTQKPQRIRVTRRQKYQKLTPNREQDVTTSDLAETRASEKPETRASDLAETRASEKLETNIVIKDEGKDDSSEKRVKENKEPVLMKPTPVKSTKDDLDFLLSLKAPVQEEEPSTLSVIPGSLELEEDVEMCEAPVTAVVFETSKPQSLEDWLDDFLDD